MGYCRVLSRVWALVHAQEVDDPVRNRYTHDHTLGQTYFFVTDGRGRQYAVGRADRWDCLDDENYTRRVGKYSGAGGIATSLGAQRLPSTASPGVESVIRG